MTRVLQRQDVRLLLVVFIPPLLLLLGIAVIAVVRDLDMGAIFRDPSTVMEGYPLVGAMSSLGIVLWWLAAGICLFTLALARRVALGRPMQVFLLTSGLLSMLLDVDDQFLFHDALASQYLDLRERDVMGAYVLLVAGWLVLNRAIIRRSAWPILVASLLVFAISVGADYVIQISAEDVDAIGTGLDWGIFLEDGLKFMGIAGWAAYLVHTSYRSIIDHDQAEARPVEA